MLRFSEENLKSLSTIRAFVTLPTWKIHMEDWRDGGHFFPNSISRWSIDQEGNIQMSTASLVCLFLEPFPKIKTRIYMIN